MPEPLGTPCWRFATTSGYGYRQDALVSSSTPGVFLATTPAGIASARAVIDELVDTYTAALTEYLYSTATQASKPSDYEFADNILGALGLTGGGDGE